MRGIFFSEDDAREVERVLAGDGFEVSLIKVAYAGEDDDEDHAWAVGTDAPDVVLEVFVDRFDGWLDDEDEEPAARPPLDLPSAPRRHHRPPD